MIKDKLTTADQRIETIAIKKHILLSSFIDAIKEVAIDCDLFKNHNMIEKEYKCFQFTEESLFLYPINQQNHNQVLYIKLMYFPYVCDILRVVL